MKLAVLGSTRGTNLLHVATAIKENHLPAVIEIVVSNKSDALILERARGLGLNALFVDPEGTTREEYDRQLSTLLSRLHIDLIVLIGYMRILSPLFVTSWENKIINVHPSLLPAHAGKMDLEVHKEVLKQGHPETGCTVHYVTQKVDAGPIILQKKCEVRVTDTPEALKERVQALEGVALVEAIERLSSVVIPGRLLKE